MHSNKKYGLLMWMCLVASVICMGLANDVSSLLIGFCSPMVMCFAYWSYEGKRNWNLTSSRWEAVKELLYLIELPEGERKSIDETDHNKYLVSLDDGLFQIKFEDDTAKILEIEKKEPVNIQDMSN